MPVVSVGRDALFERLGDWFGATKGQPSKEGKFEETVFLEFMQKSCENQFFCVKNDAVKIICIILEFK
jgi:hypothetical protein